MASTTTQAGSQATKKWAALNYGYDGPCPPWNDSIAHRYIFTVYALGVEKLAVAGEVTGANVRAALKNHVLAEASIGGTYTLNPRLQK